LRPALCVSAPQSGSFIDFSVQFAVGKFGTFVYDADIDSWLKWGGDTARFDTFLQNGVPVEVMLQLCKDMGAHPWFCTPYLACDPITDWMSSLATYVKAHSVDDNSAPWMIPRYEVVPNECWNWAAYFNSTRYAWLKSYAHWGSHAGGNNVHDWVGLVASTNGQLISSVYGHDRTKYQAIVGVQTAAAPLCRQL
jgi:hypothetical protein